MVKKTHSATVRVTGGSLRKLVEQKKNLKISPENEGEIELTIVFKSKSTLTRLQKNFKAGKSTLIKPDMIEDIIEHATGGSIWGKIKDFAKSKIVKDVVKTVAPMAINAAKTGIMARTGNPMLANVSGELMNAGVNSYTGQGVIKLKSTKKVGKGFFDSVKGLSKKAGKALAPLVAKEVGKRVAQYSGNEALGDASKSLFNAGSQYALSGEGLGGSMMPLGRGTGGSMLPLGKRGGAVTDDFSTVRGAPILGNVGARMQYVRSFRK